MYVFRVRGLPKNTTPEALKQLLVEQADEQVTLEVTDVCPAPGGLPGAEETCTAIFGVEGKIPAFLQPLMKDSVPAVTFKHYGHTVEIDKNFYGFTQLYPNSGDFIKAEYASCLSAVIAAIKGFEYIWAVGHAGICLLTLHRAPVIVSLHSRELTATHMAPGLAKENPRVCGYGTSSETTFPIAEL